MIVSTGDRPTTYVQWNASGLTELSTTPSLRVKGFLSWRQCPREASYKIEMCNSFLFKKSFVHIGDVNRNSYTNKTYI